MDTLFRPQWLDVLDIFVISYLVHRVILLFRGTRAPQVVLTLASLYVLNLLAHRYEMVMTGWLLGEFYSYAAIILIVIFRNEIREVLAQSNPVSLLIGRPDRRAMDLSLVADAVAQLAKDRTGALLVFQKRDLLSDLAREGTRVDASFSTPLVLSIFAKESPIHDGAAIIKNGRIERAGTFLPLSVREGLPTEFGTRHRAAIGLSELSDAVVVVVSEERGEITIVQHGQVESIEDLEQLERRLLERLGARAVGQTRGGWATEIGQQALGFALVLLVVTIGWVIYSAQSVAQRMLTVPVDYRNLPEQLELIEAPDEIEIQLQGKRSLVENLSLNQISASVDLADAEAGGWYRVERGDLTIERPPGLDLVSTPLIPIRLGVWEVRAIEIRPPEIRGEPPPGFEAIVEDWQPRSIEVRIPEIEAARIDALDTRPIELALLELGPDKPTVTVQVPIALASTSARPVDESNGRVQVVVSLRPIQQESGVNDTPDEAPED